jgi:hypothetical protein
MDQNQTAYYFDNAIIPPQFIICGVKLRPYCLGHHLMLKHINSPINSETEAKSMDILDGSYWLFHAIVVCSLTFEENLELMNDDAKLKEVFAQFTKHLQAQIKIEPNWNIYTKLVLFKRYITYHFSMPMYENETKEAEKASGIGWEQGIYTALKQNLGYTESEILNMPFRKLFYEWCSVGEANGCIKVWNKSTLAQYAMSKGLLKTNYNYKTSEQMPEGTTLNDYLKSKGLIGK